MSFMERIESKHPFARGGTPGFHSGVRRADDCTTACLPVAFSPILLSGWNNSRGESYVSN
jgi:hypothetical protein